MIYGSTMLTKRLLLFQNIFRSDGCEYIILSREKTILTERLGLFGGILNYYAFADLIRIIFSFVTGFRDRFNFAYLQ